MEWQSNVVDSDKYAAEDPVSYNKPASFNPNLAIEADTACNSDRSLGLCVSRSWKK